MGTRRSRAQRPPRKDLGSEVAAPVCIHAGPNRAEVCLTENQHEVLFAKQRPRLIACGMYACVYDDPRNPDQVVKITADPYDVGGLLRAQGSGLVPRVTEAAKLRQQGATPLYGLKVERVYPLDPDEKRAAGVAFEHVRRRIHRVKDNDMSAEAACADTPAWGGPDAPRICAEMMNVAVGIRRLGIFWTDVHEDNFGRDRTGKLVALDVGLSDVKPDNDLEVLQGRRSKRRTLTWRRRKR